MWTTNRPAWVLHDPAFEADALDPERASGPWAGHRWFVYDLLRHRTPERVVELGTHYGVSLFAMAQAVKDAGTDVELHAVDTWEGDPHAGLYGPDVLESFERVRAAAYPGVRVVRHQKLFDEALADVEDGSVDLLHVDGFHSYEAARTDFETWLPKLATDALVLFHDVAPDTGYGSADYWAEVSQQHPSFSFDHSFGLGVLLPRGTQGWDVLVGEELARYRAYYPARWYAHLHGLQVRDQERMIDERDEAIRHQSAMIDDRDEAIAAQARLVDERDEALREAHARLEVLEREAGAAAARAEQERAARGALRALAGRALVLAGRVAGRAGRLAGPGAAAAAAVPLPGRVDADVKTIFDAGWYASRYPDVPGGRRRALSHYLQHGGAEGRDPSPFFSGEHYLTTNPDVATAGANPLVHYVRHGAAEGRAPSRVFDTRFYRATYPDAADPGTNPLVHYLTTGVREGRFVSAEHRRRVLHQVDAGAPAAIADVRRTVDRVVLAEPGAAPQQLPLRALATADVDLVTFDVWDTLVGRERPADSAKLATARRTALRHAPALRSAGALDGGLDAATWELHEARVRAEAEIAGEHEHEEYLLVDVLDRVLARCVPGFADDDEQRRAEAEHLARQEWDDELATTHPVPEVMSLAAGLRHREGGPQVVVVSDFYAGAEEMREVLARHGWDAEPDAVVVSCDRGASKRRGGALLAAVRDERGVPAERHLHVGDNRHSDYEMQLATGGRAALLRLSPSPLPGPGELTRDGVEACWEVLRRRLADLADFEVEFSRTSDAGRRALAAGIAGSVLPVAVVARAVEAAVERGLDRVHYVSREGAFLAAVHEAVADELCRGAGPAPRAVHLEVSRRSTFGASLAATGPEGIARMWAMYGDQSLRALLVSVGAEVGPFEGAAARHGLAVDEVVPGVASDARVAAFLADPQVRDLLQRGFDEQRDLLLDYLRERTDVDAAAWVMADVGWRGSIQDNLSHVLPGTHLHGVYLGLFPFLVEQPASCTKEAVGFDGGAGDDFSFAEPPAAVERPWTPHVPSTVGYRRGADGRVVAVHDVETHASPLIEDFQRGALVGARAVTRFLSTSGFTTATVRPQLRADLRAYYERPHGGTADIWFGSEHDDTFGALGVTPFGKDVPDRTWFGAEGDARMAAAAVGSRWEPGYSLWLPVVALRELRRMVEEQR